MFNIDKGENACHTTRQSDGVCRWVVSGMAWEPEVPAGPDEHTTLDADGGGAPADEPQASGMDVGEDTRAVRTAPRAISGRLALLTLNVVLFVACVALAGSVVLWPPVATPHQQFPPAQTPASTVTASGNDGQEQPGAPSTSAPASSTATGGRARRTPTPVKAPTNTALSVSPMATATTAPPAATATPSPTAGSGG